MGTTAFLRGAPLASPVFTGIPTAPNALVGVRTPQLATTQQVFDSLPDIVIGPSLITPPAAVLAASGAAVWYSANAATFLRFSLTAPRTFRYVNLQVGVSSGNIQVGISRLKGADAASLYTTRVAHSGVIACPPVNAQRVDLGFFTLPPGEYGLFLWCDNTTATFLHGLGTGITASRLALSAAFASGVPSAVTQVGVTTRWVTGLTLEADKFPTVLFGDSITQGQTWWNTMDDASGNRFGPSPAALSTSAATNAGVAGNTTAQMLARVAADVTALAPRYVSVLGGTNDVGNDVSAATTIANLTAIYNAIVAAGGKFVACTIPPRMGVDAVTPLTAAEVVLLKTVNAWIRVNYSTWAGARLCDWTWALSNGTDESSPLAANFSDNVHPNATGAAIMAPIMSRAVATWV